MRKIPLNDEEDMLDAIAEISGHFMLHVWGELNESQMNAIWNPLYMVCKMYNEGELDFEADLFSKEYQELLKLIPKRCMYIKFKPIFD